MLRRLGQAVPHRSGTQPVRAATLGRGRGPGVTRSSSGHPAPDRPVQASDERSYPVRIEPVDSGHLPPLASVRADRSASHHYLHLWARWSVVTIVISSRQASCCRRCGGLQAHRDAAARHALRRSFDRSGYPSLAVLPMPRSPGHWLRPARPFPRPGGQAPPASPPDQRPLTREDAVAPATPGSLSRESHATFL